MPRLTDMILAIIVSFLAFLLLYTQIVWSWQHKHSKGNVCLCKEMI